MEQLSALSADSHRITVEHEFDAFERNPLQFLQSRWNMTQKHNMPSHVVMYPDLVPALSRYIAEQGFALKQTFFNCHFQVDADSKIWVWKRSMQ